MVVPNMSLQVVFPGDLLAARVHASHVNRLFAVSALDVADEEALPLEPTSATSCQATVFFRSRSSRLQLDPQRFAVEVRARCELPHREHPRLALPLCLALTLRYTVRPR